MTGHEANARKGCWAPAFRGVVPGGGPRKAHLPKALRVLVFAMACPLRVKGPLTWAHVATLGRLPRPAMHPGTHVTASVTQQRPNSYSVTAAKTQPDVGFLEQGPKRWVRKEDQEEKIPSEIRMSPQAQNVLQYPGANKSAARNPTRQSFSAILRKNCAWKAAMLSSLWEITIHIKLLTEIFSSLSKMFKIGKTSTRN